MKRLSSGWSRLKKGRSPSRNRERTPTLSRGPSSTGGLFPDGLKVLYASPNAVVDICFVHGLAGGRESTWTAPGQSAPWLATLLPDALPDVRILAHGYDAYLEHSSAVSSNNLGDHARNLINDLATDREDSRVERPIVFVAHGLGGLVCKEGILQSSESGEPHLNAISVATKAILFLGTPHLGSWTSDWAGIPARDLGIATTTDLPLLEVLQSTSEFLESIHDRFMGMIRRRARDQALDVACFYEELPLPGTNIRVVSKASAAFPGFSPISIHAHHLDMVKFQSAEDTGFKRVLGVLTRWCKDVKSAHREAFLVQRGSLGTSPC